MEAILTSLPSRDVPALYETPPELADIYTTLSTLLRHLSAHSASASVSVESPARWLYRKCSSLSSPLGPLQFTLAVLAALHGSNKEQDMFDLFGEQDVELLFEIMGRESEFSKVTDNDIRKIAGQDGDSTAHQDSIQADTAALDAADQLNALRNEAYELTNLLSTLRNDLTSSSIGPAGSGTHTVLRKSDREAEKLYKKAVKQAAIAIERAREAGALTDVDVTILTSLKDGKEIDYSQFDDNVPHYQRGLDGMDARQIQLMKDDLLPEGTKVYDTSFKKGLPRNAIREIKEGYEQVIIPAPVLDRSKLPQRIVLDDVLGEDERKAFAGTNSLNPMQSTVFDAAYLSRENLLICAPTGAGVSFFVSVDVCTDFCYCLALHN